MPLTMHSSSRRAVKAELGGGGDGTLPVQDLQRQRQDRPVIRQPTDTIGSCPAADGWGTPIVSTAFQAESAIARLAHTAPRAP